MPVDKLAKRTAANAVMPYPPGIPMLMSGENFGDANSPQIGYLRGMQNREQQFPGFAGVIEGRRADRRDLSRPVREDVAVKTNMFICNLMIV